MIKYNVRTAPVNIDILKIGNSRMTLSVFKQIRISKFFDQYDEPRGEILGYINKDGFWLMWVLDEELRKTKLPDLSYDLKRMTDMQISTVYCRSILHVLRGVFMKKFSNPNIHDEDRLTVDQEVWVTPSEANLYQSFREKVLSDEKQLFISM